MSSNQIAGPARSRKPMSQSATWISLDVSGIPESPQDDTVSNEPERNSSAASHTVCVPAPDDGSGDRGVDDHGLDDQGQGLDDQGLAEQFRVTKYMLLSRLAAGFMSRVYLGETLDTHERVAIKLVRVAKDRVSSLRVRVEREWQVLNALSHRNIIRAYNFGIVGDVHFLVMPYLTGPTLQQFVNTFGPLDYPVAARFISQAADALAHAHTAGVVHRDIKPSNFLVAEDRQLMLMDFGMARVESQGSSLTLANLESLLGTIDYMAPEQAIACHKVDGRADLYSLGCMLYFSLTGQPPFPTGTPAMRLLQHQGAQPADLRLARPDAPDALVSLCENLMAKRPADRLQTAAAVRDVLDSWLASRN